MVDLEIRMAPADPALPAVPPLDVGFDVVVPFSLAVLVVRALRRVFSGQLRFEALRIKRGHLDGDARDRQNPHDFPDKRHMASAPFSHRWRKLFVRLVMPVCPVQEPGLPAAGLAVSPGPAEPAPLLEVFVNVSPELALRRKEFLPVRAGREPDMDRPGIHAEGDRLCASGRLIEQPDRKRRPPDNHGLPLIQKVPDFSVTACRHKRTAVFC